MRSEFQQETITLQDRFEVTGYSSKPFYKLTQEENQALGAKSNKNIIFFKATLIKADEPNNHPQPAILKGDWMRKNREKWPGLPITMGHPDFKSNIKMKGRAESDIVRDILAFQEQFSVGRIMKVDDHPTDKKLQNFYGYLDNPSLVKGIMNGETLMPRYGSPYFWHLGDIDRESFDKDGNFLIGDHAPVHWAFVKNPAMGREIQVHSFCTGEEMACLQKMQSNSTIGDDSNWNAVVPWSPGIMITCPAALVESDGWEGLDKSFYVQDPLSLKMSSNSNQKTDQEVKDFMEGDKPKNGSMPPTNNPDGEGPPPNPGEQVDRTKAEGEKTTNNYDGEKKPEESSPAGEEKNKLETMIEEVRAKAEKSITKKFEKLIQEKDAEIAKRDKEIGELRFKEKLEVINQHIPDELFGTKEEDKKKAAEEREFYAKLAKEKGMTTEELTRILGRNTTVKELKVGIGSVGKKGQANSADPTPDHVKDSIKEFVLSDKTTNTFITDSKTTEEDKKKIKDSVNNFFR